VVAVAARDPAGPRRLRASTRSPRCATYDDVIADPDNVYNPLPARCTQVGAGDAAGKHVL
jgi:predicted dehydrogenase